MASAPRAAFLLMCVLMVPTLLVGGSPTEPQAGEVLDVLMFDAACISDSECQMERPAHLVEYFAADWCEPCYEVAPLVNNASTPEVLVMQHPSSPADESYNSLSNQRFEQEYRLVFYPSIIVDGEALLTGARQALDLPTVISNSTSSWGGLGNVTVSNGTLMLNDSDLSGLKLTMWATQPTINAAGNMTHAHLVTGSWLLNGSENSLNLSNFPISQPSTVVLILETEGPKRLTVASLAPTGGMDVIGSDEGQHVPVLDRAPWAIAAVVGTILVLCLAPAILMHRRLMNPNNHGESE